MATPTKAELEAQLKETKSKLDRVYEDWELDLEAHHRHQFEQDTRIQELTTLLKTMVDDPAVFAARIALLALGRLDRKSQVDVLNFVIARLDGVWVDGRVFYRDQDEDE